MTDSSNNMPEMTIGLDVGDKYCQLRVLNTGGEILEEGRVRTTPLALERRFCSTPPLRIALDVGQHSPWISRLLDLLWPPVNGHVQICELDYYGPPDEWMDNRDRFSE
jgi:hypothetical protein